MARFHSSSGLAHLVLHESPETVVQPGPVTAWLAGSGIERKKYSDITTWLRHRWFVLMQRQSVPTVLDAGALYLAGTLDQPTLVTPHAGELSKLFAEHNTQVTSEMIEADPATWALTASQQFGVTVLLKGFKTVVANGDRLIALPKATPWLATAGSGDVLAGIIGALVATNYIEILNDPDHLAEVAAAGVFIHNQAALLASLGGPISASMITAQIPNAIRKVIS
jgi:NAD(P)H-hydrate repair Nnr-like enzyme with NAD(P)H-hydrate dehydratase domain